MVFLISYTSQQLEYYRDKKIYITSAAYTDYKIVYDVAEINDPPIIIWSDNYKTPKFTLDDISYIMKQGNRYHIKTGPKYLCSKNKNIVVCEKGSKDTWEITKQNFGYNISKEGLCITASETKLYLTKCQKNKYQLFEFIVRPVFLDCLDLLDFSAKSDGTHTDKKNRSIVNRIKKQLQSEDLAFVNDKIAEKLQIDDISALKKSPDEANFNKYLDKTIPEIKTKNKAKEILDKLWEKDFGIPWWEKAWNAFKNFFC